MNDEDETINGANGNEEKVLCPSCERPTSPREIVRGVCKFCLQSFARAHTISRAAKFSQPKESGHVVEPSRDAFTRDDLVPFDLQCVERALGEFEATPEDTRTEAAELVGRIMSWCWDAASIRAAFARFAILSRGIRPDLCGMNFSQIARALNSTKQNVSKAVVLAESFWGLKFRNGRQKAGRDNMRAARLKNPVGRVTKEHLNAKLP